MSRSSTLTFEPGRRLTARPHIGDVVGSKYGLAIVLDVQEHGMRLRVATEHHGNETLQRAKNGVWAVYDNTIEGLS